jgi:metallo-beta-lactamase class B
VLLQVGAAPARQGIKTGDVQLGDHGAQYNMQEKFAKLKEGAPNPFIDPASCTLEADVEEAMFHAILAEQQQAARP